MMYIEQAPLGGNLLKILKKSASFSDAAATGTQPEANGTALINKSVDGGSGANVFNNINSEKGTVNGRSPISNGNCHTDILRPLEAIRKRVINEREQQRKTQEKFLACPEEEEEEEQYELVDVVEEEEGVINTKTEYEDHDNIPNGFSIEFEDIDTSFNLNNSRKSTYNTRRNKETLHDEDFDEEYEYRLVKVPKRHLNKSNQESQQYRVIPRNWQRVAPPATNYFNRNSNQQRIHNYRLNNLGNSYDIEPLEENSYYNEDADDDYYNYSGNNRSFRNSTGFGNQSFNDYFPVDEQMGIDIIGGLRQLFNWSHRVGGRNNDNTETDFETGKRKRRSENLHAEAPYQFKYRKVGNHFPKIITGTLDDDLDGYPPYSGNVLNNQRNTGVVDDIINSHINNYDMAQRGADENQRTQRRSWFGVPKVTKKIVRNTSYADIEFSDDEDEDTRRLKQSLGIASTFDSGNSLRKQPRVVNIPIRQEQQQHRNSSTMSTSSYIQKSSLGQQRLQPFTTTNYRGIEPLSKPTYADALRMNMPFGQNTGHILGGNSTSSNASSPGGASISRLGNGFASSSRISSQALGRSILLQEREKREHDKYKQLLETIMPHSNINETLLQNRAQNATSTATTINPLRSANTNKKFRLASKFGLPTPTHRPPLSSTINVDDDDDEDYGDVTITGVSQSKPPTPLKKREPLRTSSTVVLDDDDDDDDDISEIIDLGKSQSKRRTTEVIDLDAKENKNNDLPYVEPVNSLRDILNSIPRLKDDWLNSLNTKWEEKRKLREAELNKTVEIADKLTAERRAAESDLQERLRDFRIVEPDLLVVDDFEQPVEDEEPEFPPLDAERNARIQAAIRGPPDQVLVEKFNMNISRRDIHTLMGHNWLNDEVINFYMNLLMERSELKHDSHGYPRVYAMNTFFLQRLTQNGHGGVKRWTRKVNIFEKDVIPVPVHVGGMHWCMAIIHLKNRFIRYYDSMGTPNPQVLVALEQYLKDESLDKRKQPFDTSGFEIESVRDVPRQMNGSDCGVFSCMFAEYITRNKEINFSQEHMEYFRYKMIFEIVQGELLT